MGGVALFVRPLAVPNVQGLGDLFEAEFASMIRNFKPESGSLNAHNLVSVSNRSTLKPLMYVHVHKSLGTWMCWAANAHGAATHDDADCSEREDSCWGASEFDSTGTCAARVQQLERHNWTFYEIERFVDFSEGAGDWCPQQFSYSMIVRDPIKRAASQMSANKQTVDDIRGWFDTPKVFTQRAGFITSHIPYDNFYVRTLCGLECFFLPPGAITAAHLEKAKQQLEQLDAVLMADDLLTQLIQVEALTGWRGLQESARRFVHNNGCARAGTNCTKWEMSPSAEEFLRSHNQLDFELYDYAADVASRKTIALSRYGGLSS